MKHAFLLLAPLCLAPSAFSQEKSPEKKTELPLRQVVLFSSGVGYFSRSGQVEDDATVDLTVRAPQISDLLKSLVLFDEKGTVAPVSYSIADYLGSRPLETDLQIPQDATPGAILRVFRGANVVLTRKDGGKIEGRIASVSTRQVFTDKGVTVVEVVNLLTPIGLQSLDLSEVVSFQFSDLALQTKFLAALEKSAGLLTTKLDDGARRVTLRFNGRGKRNARAGYLLEMPTWKTSYRLVLDDAKKPFLQGWAIVENPTDADWKEVSLSLVAGRPISFIQNLSAPVYIARPVIDNTIPNAGFTPQTFGDGLGAIPPKLAISPEFLHRTGNAAAITRLEDSARQRAQGMFKNSGGFAAPAAAPAPGIAADLAVTEMAQIANISSIQSQASGEEAGELFVYTIDAKLNLARGQAAMVPIVSQNVDGDALSILNNGGNFGTQTPQNGFRLRNNSDLRLSGGPITVYQGGIYGGDALLTSLSPRDSKLIAYGLDLDLTAKREDDDESRQLLQIIAEDSVIKRRVQTFLTQKYALKNRSTRAKTVLIQQPSMGGWELIDPKQRDEKSLDGDRFKVELKAGEARDFVIKWQRTEFETMAIGDFDFANLDVYLRDKKIAPELKAKLDLVAAKRARVRDLQSQIDAQNRALKSINDDQNRLRENMKVLDKSSKLYQSYEKKLGDQEERIMKIDAEIERLQTAKRAAETELQAAISAVA